MSNDFETIEAIATDFHKKVKEVFPDEKNMTRLLCKIVSLLGGKIIGTNNPEYYEINGGSLRVKKIGDFIIKLPMDTSPLSDNFTIVHELGHYLIHYREEDKEKIYAMYGNSTEEIQANRFAAAFLMPKDDFIKACSELKNSVPLLAARFQVSTDSVRKRMEYIG